MSKWFNQYCKLNGLDREMICEKILPMAKTTEYYEEIYINVVYHINLTMVQIDDIIDRFNSSRDKRIVKRLIEKLERLRSQS